MKSIKTTRAQALTPRLLIFRREFCAICERLRCPHVCRRILLVKSRRHLRSRYVSNGATRAHTRRRILPGRHGIGNNRPIQSSKHGPRKMSSEIRRSFDMELPHSPQHRPSAFHVTWDVNKRAQLACPNRFALVHKWLSATHTIIPTFSESFHSRRPIRDPTNANFSHPVRLASSSTTPQPWRPS